VDGLLFEEQWYFVPKSHEKIISKPQNFAAQRPPLPHHYQPASSGRL
jgi:hypothetical protein